MNSTFHLPVFRKDTKRACGDVNSLPVNQKNVALTRVHGACIECEMHIIYSKKQDKQHNLERHVQITSFQ